MHKTTWLLGMGICGAVFACGEPPKKKPEPLVMAGPAKPELGWNETVERAERAPISLTGSDGSGLELVALHARTVIEDPLAFTELHLTFHNPEPRRREGRFEIVLPQEAAVSRFAMRVGDRFQEGEVVERRRAQQVYEDFLHRKQDPALLEKDAGNEFSARVFPIEASANKEIILAYSEELRRSDEPYRLLLSGLPKLRDIKVDVRVGSSSASGRESSERPRSSVAQLELYDSNFTPQGDLEVRLPWQKTVALRSGELVLARVAPVVPAEPARLQGLTVLFDTSASRALGFGAQVERLGALIAELQKRSGDFELRLIAFDQDSEETYRGPASGFGPQELEALRARGALGATDLAQALSFVARGAAKHERMLLVGDGVVTAGAEDTTALREGVAKLAAHGVQRLDVLGEGGIRDAETLSALTRAGLAGAGVLLDAREPLGVLADKLSRATAARVEVKITGASWVYPGVLQGVQAGDERLVFAELPVGTPLQIELVGAGVAAPDLQEVPRPLLERAWTRAKIEAMTSELRALPPDATAEREAKEQAIVRLSTAKRVVSDYTALLVLETDADYERFGIAQTALTDILRVGKEGIELVDRSELEPRDDRLKVAKGDLDQERFESPTAEAEMAPSAAAVPVPADVPTGDAAPRSGHPTRGGSRGGVVQARNRAPAPVLDEAKSEGESAVRRSMDSSASSTVAAERSRRAAPKPSAVAPPAPAKVAAAPASSAPSAEPASAAPSPAPSAAAADEASMGGADQGRGAGPGTGVAAESGSGADLLRVRPSPGMPLEIATDAPLPPRVRVRLHTAYGVPSDEASRVLRSGLTARARACYERADPQGEHDQLSFELVLSDKGTVSDAYATGGSFADRRAQSCVLAAARALRFPKPETGRASVTGGVELSFEGLPEPTRVGALAPRPRPRPRPARIATPAIADAYDGVLAEVLEALRSGDEARALERARLAHAADPGDVIALVALGEALEAQEDHARAARAYGSLIDLFPSRADLRRMAGGRLERLPSAGLALAVDSYRRAVEQRPDHPSGPRSLAYALLKSGDHAGAFAALEQALSRSYAADRFEGVERILREDLALVGAAWLRAEPAAEERIRSALAGLGVAAERAPSLRFVLSWETDANDVDFHVYDGRGGHAYYMKPKLPSGGSLYADITSGYGPECFAISGKSRSFPYVLQAHYFARGPMGYGMGKLQVVEHDGQGGLRFAEHPFVIMKDKAFVELARLTEPLG